MRQDDFEDLLDCTYEPFTRIAELPLRNGKGNRVIINNKEDNIILELGGDWVFRHRGLPGKVARVSSSSTDSLTPNTITP